MTFPPHDGDIDASNDETTVLPPIDGSPELVRPYVQAVESEPAARWEPTSGPEPEAQPEPDAEAQPEPEPEPQPVAVEPVPVATVPVAAAVPVGATEVLPAPDAYPREARGGGRKGWALAGGALLLILVGTGAALLTQPSGSSPTASTTPSQASTSASPTESVSPSASVSPSPTPSHSASPSPSAKPSPTVRPTPKPSPSATRPSPSPSASRTPGAGTTLQLGSTGPAVVTLQQDLRALWIDRGLQPSGTYDQRTEQDVASFQVWYGVQGDPSGVYGPNSQAKMAQLMARGNNGGGGNNGG
ncbi:peptidoglycan-binding domain-containing protein [Streptacidiphilus fuscans]|uniref:Peptidoglycan-binding protein n=1 Tax=Streptacidiphilus fuscans TaxID=2789292 RepID=A0A931FJV2_9ACTN|nr:peptidoglycan-binding protein [Streptacidiphilus fuscans]MBF9073099.1 peptidoglycan-binding protein [Streptacidiphilus fuscans]